MIARVLLPFIMLCVAVVVGLVQPPVRPIAAVAVIDGVQARIDAGESVVDIPAGVHVLTRPLVIGTPGRFASVRVRGAGRSPLGVADASKTVLVWNGPGPAVRFVGARDSSISDLSIVGPSYGVFVPPTGPWWYPGADLSAWPASDRYDPSAGVAVTGGSSGVQIRNVDIAGFSCGVVTAPDGSDGQDEMVSIEHSRIAFTTYGVSISQSQNRRLTCRNVDFLFVHTALVNRVHGRQSGFVDGLLDSCHFNALERIADVYQSSCGVTVFSSCYGELVGSMGRFDDGAARVSVGTVFRDCYLRFTGNSVLASGGGLVLNGGLLETPDLAVFGSVTEIRGTKFRPVSYEEPGPFSQARKIACNLACGPIPRLDRPWPVRGWEPATAAYFPSMGRELQVGYSGPQPTRRVRAFPKAWCRLDGDIFTILINIDGVQHVGPGSIVQDDTGLATWFVTGSVGPVAARTFTVERLNNTPVGAGGSFVVVSPVSGPR